MMYALLALSVLSSSANVADANTLDGVWKGVVAAEPAHTTCARDFCGLAGHDGEFIFAHGQYRYFNEWVGLERRTQRIFAHVTEQDSYDNGAHINTYDQWSFATDGDKLSVYIMTSFFMQTFEGRKTSCSCAYSVSASRIATAEQAVAWQLEHLH